MVVSSYGMKKFELRRLKMTEKINEGRRSFMKVAGLTGAALMVGLHERFADAKQVGPGMIKREEIPS
jgi:hypothetical protein